MSENRITHVEKLRVSMNTGPEATQVETMEQSDECLEMEFTCASFSGLFGLPRELRNDSNAWTVLSMSRFGFVDYPWAPTQLSDYLFIFIVIHGNVCGRSNWFRSMAWKLERSKRRGKIEFSPNGHAIKTSLLRQNDTVLTLLWRYYCVVCPLG